MTDTDIFDEPPDENEAFANLDESLDDVDGVRPGAGPEGGRDLDADVVVDRTELEEAGAELDDPDRIALIDGGMDDPDGVGGPPPVDDDEAGWDVDPVTRDAARASDDVGADGDAVTDTGLDDVPGLDGVDGADEGGAIDLDTLDDDLPRPDDGR